MESKMIKYFHPFKTMNLIAYVYILNVHVKQYMSNVNYKINNIPKKLKQFQGCVYFPSLGAFLLETQRV